MTGELNFVKGFLIERHSPDILPPAKGAIFRSIKIGIKPIFVAVGIDFIKTVRWCSKTIVNLLGIRPNGMVITAICMRGIVYRTYLQNKITAKSHTQTLTLMQ